MPAEKNRTLFQLHYFGLLHSYQLRQVYYNSSQNIPTAEKQ